LFIDGCGPAGIWRPLEEAWLLALLARGNYR